MKNSNPIDDRKAFITIFNQLSRRHNRLDVFRDFVTMAAISLHNALRRIDSLENEYLAIVKRYEKSEVNLFPTLLAHTINLLEPEPVDILGPLYMELELGNKNAGQFFTPSSVCELMAKLNGPDLEQIDKPYIKFSEPCCGAGAMSLAFVKQLIAAGHNPAEKLWMQCIDIDRTVALMCYIQLTLWNVPAQVIVGDTLRLEYREQWFTPAHWMNGWPRRFAAEEALSFICEPPAEPDSINKDPGDPPAPRTIKPGKFEQISLF